MFSFKDQAKIEAILESENVDEMIAELLEMYVARSDENAKGLLRQIPVIAEKTIAAKQREIGSNRRAALFLMMQQKMSLKDARQEWFSTMLPVCETIFPEGRVRDEAAEYKKAYFKEFLDLFRDPKIFDWNDPDAVSWAKHFEYYEYLKLVDAQNPVQKGGECCDPELCSSAI